MAAVLVAAMLFLLQAAATSFAAVDTLRLDAFGNPLCITGADHAGRAGDPGGTQGKLPQCCLSGCMAGNGQFGGPPADAVVATLPPLDMLAPVKSSAGPLCTARGHRANNPRAPPLTA